MHCLCGKDDAKDNRGNRPEAQGVDDLAHRTTDFARIGGSARRQSTVDEDSLGAVGITNVNGTLVEAWVAAVANHFFQVLVVAILITRTFGVLGTTADNRQALVFVGSLIVESVVIVVVIQIGTAQPEPGPKRRQSRSADEPAG